jgi:hypothetical protein
MYTDAGLKTRDAPDIFIWQCIKNFVFVLDLKLIFRPATKDLESPHVVLF